MAFGSRYLSAVKDGHNSQEMLTQAAPQTTVSIWYAALLIRFYISESVASCKTPSDQSCIAA